MAILAMSEHGRDAHGWSFYMYAHGRDACVWSSYI
jgi:hypothetical protein